ncbi:DNA cytosine methyltransferase [Pseudomonas sp. LG1E9]|uniref:DNA cytosine methyltransferase n=1 Tax=Pseudomonas sp. LG1E9 TaxID=2219057 RepID=UPI0021152459|nr:DNA cytosine methyltransferase [Pseudomonas sp. LG1E9]
MQLGFQRFMKLSSPIQIVDLFAGPGGLGEGFSSFLDAQRFRIIVSAEMDSNARNTLRLRSFFRLLKSDNPDALGDYYNFCNGLSETPWSERSKKEWDEAGKEARCITLGTKEGNAELDEILDRKLDKTRPWVLIGGPPCQAYSMAGRSRNRSKANYNPEDDHRHFLYKEYLRIIHERQPAIFVMENVKGILSSTINGEKIFKKILEDLSDPDKALGGRRSGRRYKICSFVRNSSHDEAPIREIDPKDYIIRAEKYGIPQARHRVILLGIAVDAMGEIPKYVELEKIKDSVSVRSVLQGLPAIRSRLTRGEDTDERWSEVVREELISLMSSVDRKKNHRLGEELDSTYNKILASKLRVGALRTPIDTDVIQELGALDNWYLDKTLTKWLNHDARGHMPSDLRRYVFAASFAHVKGYSPKGHLDFNLPGLAPAHKNWTTGKFSDRFRVQCENLPSSTITSHISKDGHYFIHYDPVQCRSLSVREAARLQTFPDNYFFQGNRSQQYHQVGNAVPPLLAYKIASVVSNILSYIKV